MLKGLGGLAGLGDMAKMMKTAQEMQEKLGQMQQDLAELTVTGEAGAGLVRVTASAKGAVTGLEIDPSILVASEKEVVEDLILAAIRHAQGRAQEAAQRESQRLAESLGLPPGLNLPF